MNSHIDGMKYCLELIEELKKSYAACNYKNNDLPIEKVIADIENEIGCRAYRDWEYRGI